MAILEVQFGEMWHLLGGWVIFFDFWKGPYPAFMRFKCTNSSCWACASGAAKGQWHLWLPSMSMHACLCVSDSRFRQQSRVVMTKGSCKAREESEPGEGRICVGVFSFCLFLCYTVSWMVKQLGIFSFGQSLLVSHRAFLQLLAVCQCCHHLMEQHNSALIKLSTVMELDLDCFASVTVVHCWSMLSPRTRRLDSSQIWR